VQPRRQDTDQGRSKEILKIGGHRVSPIEIEQVVARHPDLVEAAVIGVPHDLMGEVPAAIVVSRPGHRPSDDELRRFCQEQMPSWKVPVKFAWVEGLLDTGSQFAEEVASARRCPGTRPESCSERSWRHGRSPVADEVVVERGARGVGEGLSRHVVHVPRRRTR
jgi:hypothetical protein